VILVRKVIASMGIVDRGPVHVYILVVVNVAKAQEKGLKSNCYLFSTSSFHGADRPITTVRKGNKIVWRVMPIDADRSVRITRFGGTAVPGMVEPAPMEGTDHTMWSSLVMQAGHDVAYEVTLTFDDDPRQYAYTCGLTTTTPRSGGSASG
jgi:hypothetical protein